MYWINRQCYYVPCVRNFHDLCFFSTSNSVHSKIPGQIPSETNIAPKERMVGWLDHSFPFGVQFLADAMAMLVSGRCKFGNKKNITFLTQPASTHPWVDGSNRTKGHGKSNNGLDQEIATWSADPRRIRTLVASCWRRIFSCFFLEEKRMLKNDKHEAVFFNGDLFTFDFRYTFKVGSDVGWFFGVVLVA